tara:strand:+ start:170 stop:598 length:429 start_codon:yes stop_codon:yes gene_type:complete
VEASDHHQGTQVPYYSKQEKENKMTKKYRTKQTLIDEQEHQIKDLGYKIRLKEQMLEHSSNRIKEEARKVSDMVSPQATITVWEDHYRPDTPMTLLATVQLWDEVISKTHLLREMNKLSEALSAFYKVYDGEIRINMSINRY